MLKFSNSTLLDRYLLLLEVYIVKIDIYISAFAIGLQVLDLKYYIEIYRRFP